jgi:anaerobic selenocysteine-containing dehydrogenase
MLDFQLRTGPYGDAFSAQPGGLSLDTLAAAPHGIDKGPLVPRIPEVLRTPSGCIELAPPELVADVERLLAERGRFGLPGALVLVGRRDLRSNNSWMHNLEVLVKGRPRCTLQVHPHDAADLGLCDGGGATVASRVHAVEVIIEVTDAVMPGVVSLPHGWGHDEEGVEIRVARRYGGVNTNLLTDERRIDALSGNAALNGVPVTVTAL